MIRTSSQISTPHFIFFVQTKLFESGGQFNEIPDLMSHPKNEKKKLNGDPCKRAFIGHPLKVTGTCGVEMNQFAGFCNCYQIMLHGLAFLKCT